MKYSSAKQQLAFDYDAPATGPQQESGGAVSADTTVNFPTFARYDVVYAVTSRIAGRINAASISDAEHRALLRERQGLLNKKFENTINRQELNRLEYVRWSLDRIEDAKHGQPLQALDDEVKKYENILEDLQSLGHQLEAALPRKKRK